MEKSSIIFLLIICSAFLSCDDDEVNPVINAIPDTAHPVVEISSPVTNDSILVIDVIEITATATDDKRLENVRVILEEPGGGSQVISDVTVTIYSNFKNYSVSEFYRIPKYAATGIYTVTVEAKDIALKKTNNAVSITLHASDVSKAAFLKPFSNAFANSSYMESLSWFGYNFENDLTFDDIWLSTLLNLMASTDTEYGISENEWRKFIEDFGVRNQAWATWDKNRDGNLDDKEFHEGITSLNFFKDWDENGDKLVNKEELAAGFFERWDHNQDNRLSREEYLEKFYNYLYSDWE